MIYRVVAVFQIESLAHNQQEKLLLMFVEIKRPEQARITTYSHHVTLSQLKRQRRTIQLPSAFVSIGFPVHGFVTQVLFSFACVSRRSRRVIESHTSANYRFIRCDIKSSNDSETSPATLPYVAKV